MGLTEGLEVEGGHLAARVPEELRLEVGGIHAGPFGVNAAQLPFVVPFLGGALRKHSDTKGTPKPIRDPRNPIGTPETHKGPINTIGAPKIP